MWNWLKDIGISGSFESFDFSFYPVVYLLWSTEIFDNGAYLMMGSTMEATLKLDQLSMTKTNKIAAKADLWFVPTPYRNSVIIFQEQS